MSRSGNVLVRCFVSLGLVCLVCVPEPTPAQAPEPLVQFFGQARADLQGLFEEFAQEVRPEAVASVLVAPTRHPPGDLDNFPAEGRLIGALYTSMPLARFGLKQPGVYAIRLRRTDQQTWQAALLNAVGLASSVFTVDVKPAEAFYEQPQAFFTFFTRGIVICWQQTCVEM